MSIKKLDPKDIVDTTIQTIPLEAVKQLHDEEMQGYDDIIRRLQSQLEEAQKLTRYAASYKALYDELTLSCPRDRFVIITIIQCAGKIRRGECNGHPFGGCKRNEILRKIGVEAP